MGGLIALGPASLGAAHSRMLAARSAGSLTQRETDIAAFVGAGLSNRELAAKLYISERTVDAHITRIRSKLAVTSRTQLAVWAIANCPPAPLR